MAESASPSSLGASSIVDVTAPSMPASIRAIEGKYQDRSVTVSHNHGVFMRNLNLLQVEAGQ